MLEFFKNIRDYLVLPDTDSLNMSLNNVHKEGLFSLVINGTEAGKLTRVFIAHKKIKPFDVQIHSHRYPINLTVIKGSVIQHVAKITTKTEDSVVLSKYNYQSFLNGERGLTLLKRRERVKISDFIIPVGSSLHMDETELHTISCSKGSIWIVEEKGFRTDSSIVLGIPFTPDKLYTEPKQFQINDNAQLVLKELNRIINNYETAN